MEWPSHTIAIPTWRDRQDRADFCGAFGNLYRVIGKCNCGVPETDEAGDTMIGSAAYVEMMIARARMNYCIRSDNKQRGVSVSTIQEMMAAVVSKKFIGMFNEWCKTLEQMGYTNFWQVLNAKTHGYPTPVPQNRKRVFMVSILDCDRPFVFPEAQELTTRLADVLEDKVDEKYYISDARISGLLESTQRERERGNGFKFEPKTGSDIAGTINTKAGTRKVDNYIKEDET